MTLRVQLEGAAGSRGIAVGRARVLYPTRFEVDREPLATDEVDAEVARFLRALESAREELAALRRRLRGSLTREIGDFIEAHALILDDPEFIDGVTGRIRGRLQRASAALDAQREALAAAFDAIDDPYLRSRREDLEQVIARVFAAFRRGGGPAPRPEDGTAGTVLVCESLSPADLDWWHEHGLVAIVCTQGSVYSHSAILARGLRVPMVVGCGAALDVVRDGDTVLVDADAGRVTIAPDAIDLRRLREHQRAAGRAERARALLKSAATRTRDGAAIALHANAEQPEQIARARRVGADGIGLFRTEFLYLRAGEAPSEDEQFRAYRDAVMAMAGRPVTLRTLDLGADKPGAGALGVGPEPNPALGLRGVRWSLARRAHFMVQLRAMLRASAYGPVRILLPMVTAVEEVLQVADLVDGARRQLQREGIAVAEQVPLGAMIEVPAAVVVATEIAHACDFLALGSNDLVQYTLAADRNNAAVAATYDPLHPAVLRLIALTVESARRARRPLTLCGELAGSVDLLPLLLALGLDAFSMHPGAILEARERLLGLSRKALRARRRRLLQATSRDEVLERLRTLSED
jgi:phosphotransferase system enzyme I (PtsI)